MPYRIAQCYLPPGRGYTPAFTPAEAGTRLSDPGGMQGWVDLVGLLYTEIVYPSEDGHPSKYWPGPTCVNFLHATNSANHYATTPRSRIWKKVGNTQRTFMTSCLRKLVRVCLAVISLTAFSHRLFKRNTIVPFHVKISDIIFSVAVLISSHSSYLLSFIDIFA